MLYLTTRDKTDAFTAAHALQKQRGKCGGLFVPYQLPMFSPEEIKALSDFSFGQRMAKLLNRFFNTEITGWDIDFAVGRRPVRLAAMSHKIAVMEAWHNHDGDFEELDEALFNHLKYDPEYAVPGEWFRIAVRISALFAVFGDLIRTGVAGFANPMDIAVAVNDFEAPMAAWYARKMGLPIGTIVCCCNENSGLWELLRHGQLQTGAKIIQTNTPDNDRTVPNGLERLIYETLGFDETQRFVDVCAGRGLYSLNPEKLTQLNRGFYCAVVRQQRVDSVIGNVFNTNA